jgi:hypothetical protein
MDQALIGLILTTSIGTFGEEQLSFPLAQWPTELSNLRPTLGSFLATACPGSYTVAPLF